MFKNNKKTMWVLGVVLFLFLVMGDAHIVHADTTGIYTLKADKTYNYDLDGDGKKESLKIEFGKSDGYVYYGADIYINGEKVLTINDYFYVVNAQVLIMSKKNVFIYLTPSAENGDGTKIIYQYKNGRLKKIIDFEKMGRYANVEKVTKNKITMNIRRTWSAIGCFSYECNLVYKNGKLKPETKTYMLDSYSQTEKAKKPYLTAKNNIQIYESHNTNRKSFVLKKGQKVKITKYYFNGKIHMFQVKMASGKKGWFLAPNDYEELFEEAYGVG